MSYKLICLDLDGTLVARDTEEILPGVVKHFLQLKRPYPIYAVLSNQGGVGYGNYREMQGKERGNFPTLKEAGEHLQHSIESIHDCLDFRPIRYSTLALRYQNKNGEWFDASPKFSTKPGDEDNIGSMLTWSRLYRKPNPGMIWMAMMIWDALPEETLMVGDSDEDKQAALAAGCAFEWAHIFFGRDKLESD